MRTMPSSCVEPKQPRSKPCDGSNERRRP
jgi:hypothetical protein